MWEIISTATGQTHARTALVESARAHVFGGGFFAYNSRDGFLVLDPRNGRVALLYFDPIN